MTKNYNLTRFACYLGYISQAAALNFAPLCFVIFNREYGASLEVLGLLISTSFIVQMLTDLIMPRYIDKVGYKLSAVFSCVLVFVGIFFLGSLPELLPIPLVGIVISIIISSFGSAMLDIILSPMIETLPCEDPSGRMTLLHAFYCIGHFSIVAVSVLFFACFGEENWRTLCFFLCLLPVLTTVLFLIAPYEATSEKDKKKAKVKNLFRSKLFFVFLLLMVCAGASELSMSQWVSFFAQKGLGLSKTMGDIFGPCLFAVCMATGRIVSGRFERKFGIRKILSFCGISSFLSYLVITLSPSAPLAVAGCALCGFSVSILWPATLSYCSSKIFHGGTLMFALLALGGDIGAAAGPALIGFVSGALEKVTSQASAVKMGVLSVAIFPLMFFIIMLCMRKNKKERKGRTL